MNKKLLAVDMDGTLFNDDKTISKENLEAITKLLDAGHAFATWHVASALRRSRTRMGRCSKA